MLDYPAIDLYRFGRSDRESWQLIQFAVQVTSYLSFEEKQYIPLLSTPIPQLYLKRWLQKDKKEQRIQSIKEELLRGLSYYLKQKATIWLRNFLVISKLAKFLSN